MFQEPGRSGAFRLGHAKVNTAGSRRGADERVHEERRREAEEEGGGGRRRRRRRSNGSRAIPTSFLPVLEAVREARVSSHQRFVVSAVNGPAA